MIPAQFDYVKATTVNEAVNALVEHGEYAKLLAGGHSLIPLMRYRLATPDVLIDISKIEELQFVRDGGDHLAVGALTKHVDIEMSTLVQSEAPLLAKTVSMVGDPQVRNRGTIGGSIAHGDPASDTPSALLALGATILVTGPDGAREIAIDEFFTGFLETAMVEHEILTEIRVPKVTGKGWAFNKFTRRSQDWAVVAAAVQHHDDGVRIGLVNMHSTPARALGTEQALRDGQPIEAAAALAAQGMSPPTDDAGSAEYRMDLASVVLEDALREAGG